MTWVRKEDTFPRHRKIRRLTDSQYRMHDEAMCWCSEHRTDGQIPRDELDDVTFVKSPAKQVAALIARGLWHAAGHDCTRCAQPADPKGWVIHDYLDYNPSRAEVEADRKAARERMARRRRNLRGKFAERSGEQAPEQEPEQPANEQENFAGSSEGVRPPRPVPSRPGSSSNFEEPPNPPAEPGGGCAKHGDKPAPNCRGCGTNSRAVQAAADAAARQPPPWCGTCDQATRQIETDDGRPARCPRCHPLVVREEATTP